MVELQHSHYLPLILFHLLSVILTHLVGVTAGDQDKRLMPYLMSCENGDFGSGGASMINIIACPEPDFISITMTNQSTLTVNFSLSCLPTPEMECVYNYTVEFYPRERSNLLASTLMMLTPEEVNMTAFTLSSSLLRERTDSFEMGVVINVTVFRVDGNETSGQFITQGDFSPSILDLTIETPTTNTSIEISWTLPFPTAPPDIYTIRYKYIELSGVMPRTGEDSLDVSIGSNTTYVITNLMPYTMYDINVTAVYGDVSSDNVSTVGQTAEGVSSPVLNLTVEANTETMMFTIKWTEPEFPAGIITNYTVSVSQYDVDDLVTIINVPTLEAFVRFEFFESYNISVTPVNGFGEGDTSIIVMETAPQGVPSPPMNFLIQRVINSSTSLSASWTIPSTLNGVLTNYSVYCRVSSEQFYPEQEPVGGKQSFMLHESTSPENTSLIVNGLRAFTSYDCYVTASTNGGESEPSNNETATTDEDSPTFPTNFNYTELTSVSVTLEWNRPATPNGEITEYIVEYTNSSLDQPLDIVIPVAFNRSLNEYSITSISVNYLNEFTIYEFNISAVTGGGRGQEATITITTNEAAPSAIPVNLSGVNTSSTSLFISWEPLPEDDRNGVILGYNVTYFSSDSDSVATSTNDTMINISDLLVYTVYNVSVAGFTVVGSGPFGSITVRTASVPTAPQNLTYKNLTSTSIEVSWYPPATFNGLNEGYEIAYLRVETNETKTENVMTTSINITNLEIYEEYSIEVVALSDKGAGEGVTILVLTDEDLPGIVGEFEGVEINSTAIFVEWVAPSEPNGIITRYEIMYTLVNGPSKTIDIFDPKMLSIELTGLEIFSYYDISVRAYTSVGPGNYTNNITIQTEPAPASFPLNVAAVSSGRSIILTWTAPAMPNGIIEGYYISTNATLPTDIAKATLDSNIEVLNVSSDVLRITLNDLTPFTYYEFSVAAYSFNLMDTNNNFTIIIGQFSEDQVTRTPEDLPGIVLSFFADELNSSAINVEWGPPMQPNGIITVYEVEYTLVDDDIVFVINVTSDTFSVQLMDLEAHTEYDIRVRAYTSIGPGDFTNITSVRTDPAPATPPTQVVATPSKRSIELSWMEPERPHGVIQGYYISTNATLPTNIAKATLDYNIEVLNVSSDVQSITFNDLTPFTYYKFSVAAYSFNLMDTNNNFTIITGQFSEDQVTRTFEDFCPGHYSLSCKKLRIKTICNVLSMRQDPLPQRCKDF